MLIEYFLNNSVPYICGVSYDVFEKALLRVPMYEEKFKELIKQDPQWLATAKSTKDKKGYHISFFYEERIEVIPLEEKTGTFYELFLRLYD